MINNQTLTLNKNDIHIWVSSFEQEKTMLPISEYENILNYEELKRYKSFINKNSQTQYLISRALLYSTLSKYTAIPPDDIVLSYNKYGKPYLNEIMNAQDLKFNLSHSNGIAVCALTAKREIGIDIEKIRFIKNIKSIIKKFFTADEVKIFTAFPEKFYDERFVEYWTLKEAYLKALGYGLYMPLNSISLDYESEKVINYSYTSTNSANNPSYQHKFFLFDVPPLYKLSVCVNHNQPEQCFNITIRHTAPFMNSAEITYPLIRQSS